MEQRLPLVSIIIPTYNRAHLINETLESVRNQTYMHWECIIVDDGSKDHTEALVTKICESDQRFQFFKRPDEFLSGGSGARNFGFQKSKGDYINWLDSDDIFHPKKIETDLKYLSDVAFDFTISQSEFFTENQGKLNAYWNNNIYSDDTLNDFITLDIGWATCAPLWRKGSLVNAGLSFDERLRNGQDYMYHILALEQGLKPSVIDEVLTYSRADNEKIKFNVIKAPSKAIINLYLLNNSKRLMLSAETNMFLEKQSLVLLKSMYKHKLWCNAIRYSCLKLIKVPDVKWFFQICYYFVIGSFYNMFSVGYKYLD